MNKMYRCIFYFLLLSITNNFFATQSSIILVHGFLSNFQDMHIVADKIKNYIPDAYIKIVDLGIGRWGSFSNMFEQAEQLNRELNNDPHVGNNCIMIGHSQGGLVARYYVQRYNTPRVKTLITWGAPHQGIFGSPGVLDSRFAFLNILELYAYQLFYRYFIQKHISIANYWKDTLHHEKYINQCLFLPHANNEIEHIYNDFYKENIESLDQLVLVNSTAEEVIIPSISCHFGFYQIGSIRHTETFIHSDQYKNNLLGLKTLYDQGKLIFKTAACTHMDYVNDDQNFIENTLPYLTYSS